MVSPYLLRPVRRLEDVVKVRERKLEASKAVPSLAHQLRSAAAEHGTARAFAHRPRVVWINDRLDKRRRKPGGSGSDPAA
jgi:hypothetical protein